MSAVLKKVDAKGCELYVDASYYLRHIEVSPYKIDQTGTNFTCDLQKAIQEGDGMKLFMVIQ